MKNIILVLLASCNFTYAQSNIGPRIIELDSMMNEVMDIVGFPGVALAIMKDGKVMHKANYGYASLEHEVPVGDQTSFQLYSLTKPLISIAIFQFVERAKIDLDNSVTDYVPGLPQDWKDVKVKHLMTHSSGLPDMFGSNPFEFRDLSESQAKERVFNLPIRFEPGEKYEYNQTNSWLMKEIIEKISGNDLQTHIRSTQFPKSNKESVYFLSDAREIVKHKATSYFPWIKGHLTIDLPYVNGDYFFAGNGLHVTLNEMIKWDDRFSKNELLSQKYKESMWEAFDYKKDNKVFAPGWNIHSSSNDISYGFTGSSVTMYRTIPSKKISVILLANGFENNYSQHALMEQIIQLVENQE